MSVLIRGMEMPHDKPITVTIRPDGKVWCMTGSNAPLKASEIKTPHGRLGDLDEAFGSLMKCAKSPQQDDENARWFYLFAANVMEACPTIIEEEE